MNRKIAILIRDWLKSEHGIEAKLNVRMDQVIIDNVICVFIYKNTIVVYNMRNGFDLSKRNTLRLGDPGFFNKLTKALRIYG